MITIVGMWETGWLEPKVELFMFRQLRGAFKYDRLVMVPKLLGNRTSVDEYDTMEEALESCEGELIFMEHRGDVMLHEFKHPQKAVYVFGNAMMHNLRFNGTNVRIDTPEKTDMFAVNAASIVLMDRINEHR